MSGIEFERLGVQSPKQSDIDREVEFADYVEQQGFTSFWTRNVGLMAQTWATLYELAGPRVLCGLGVWHEPLAS